ncbi:MAG TPA: response regulator [Candidatus Limnocylindria bacterium]
MPPQPRSVRLFIGDGDAEFRALLRATAAADPRFDVVGEADDGVVALRLLRSLRPDVALLDADLPSFGGSAVARILSRELPQLRVVVLARERREAWV